MGKTNCNDLMIQLFEEGYSIDEIATFVDRAVASVRSVVGMYRKRKSLDEMEVERVAPKEFKTEEVWVCVRKEVKDGKIISTMRKYTDITDYWCNAISFENYADVAVGFDKGELL